MTHQNYVSAHKHNCNVMKAISAKKSGPYRPRNCHSIPRNIVLRGSYTGRALRGSYTGRALRGSYTGQAANPHSSAPQSSALPMSPQTIRCNQWCIDGIKRKDCCAIHRLNTAPLPQRFRGKKFAARLYVALMPWSDLCVKPPRMSHV